MKPARLNEAQRQLAADNMRLVSYTLDRYYHNDIRAGEWEDFCSIGYIALCMAAASYRSDSGSEFSPYAVQAIRWSIKREFVDRSRARRSHGPMLTLGEWDEEGLTLEAAIPDDAPSVELVASLHAALDHMPEKDRQMLQWSMDGLKQREIAQRMQCTRANIGQHLTRIRSELAEQLAIPS